MLMSHHWTTQNNIKQPLKTLLKYVKVKIVWDSSYWVSCIHEIESRLNLGSAWCCGVQNVSSFCLLSHCENLRM
jgi:hypothetical protein